MTLKTLFLFLLTVQLTTAQNVVWTPVQAGIWKATVGKPEAYNLLTASGVTPNVQALAKLGKPQFPLSQPAITARVVGGKTYLRFPLNRTEQLYGFGLNFQTVHQRGRILNLHVDHFGGTDNGRTHSPTPFYVSSNGYGVFINSARYLTVYAGTAVRKDSSDPPISQDRNTDKNWSSRPYSDAVEILVPAAGVEIYVFGGPKPLDVVRRYNLFNGGGCLPPRWGLGFVQRVKSLYTADQVQAEVVYRLYDDDGETFNYEKGQYSFREIRITKQPNGPISGTISPHESGKPNTVGAFTFTQMTK